MDNKRSLVLGYKMKNTRMFVLYISPLVFFIRFIYNLPVYFVLLCNCSVLSVVSVKNENYKKKHKKNNHTIGTVPIFFPTIVETEVRGHRRSNQQWTIQRNWQHRVNTTKTNKTKTPHNMCWSPRWAKQTQIT